MSRTTGSILYSTPVTSPSKLNAAQALYEGGLLGAYHGALGFRRDGLLLRSARAIDRVAGTRLGPELGRRAVTAAPGALVRFHPLMDLVRTVAARTGRPLDGLSERALAYFDRQVSTHVKRYAGVYAFRGAARASFAAARAQGRLCIYSVGGFDPAFMQALDAAERARFPDILGAYEGEHASDADIHRTDQEWALAHRVIINSTTALESHQGRNLDLDKAVVVPLGFPEPFAGPFRVDAAEGPLRVLWAGGFTVRKGAHYLLQALRAIPEGRMELRAFGSQQLPASAMAAWPLAGGLRPTIPRETLMEEYRRADVVVMPTLSDGFGMVISEAMSQGCPVITTTRAGAAEFIRDGENGLIVPAADAEALAKALGWCIEHRDRLKAMGESARRTAARWQWADYRVAIVNAVAEALAAHAAREGAHRKR